MRTRWTLAASILVLMLLPGALRATDLGGCAPAAQAIPTASEPAPAANAANVLPSWADLNAPLLAPQTLQGIDTQPIFLAGCSGCIPGPRCTRLHSCVLNGCC